MEDFWFECRKKSGISLRQMSKLLHVSAHAYRAMEQGKIKFSPEITEMLYMMYMISPTSKVDERCLLNIEKQFAPLNEKERFYVAMKNLTGEGSYRSNYRKIKRVKDILCYQIHNLIIRIRHTRKHLRWRSNCLLLLQ